MNNFDKLRLIHDDRSGDVLFAMQAPREDTALFLIHSYRPDSMRVFKTWIHETFNHTGPDRRQYYLIVDMSRMEPLFYLSYDDCYALTYRPSEDLYLQRAATIIIMPPDEQSFFLYKALLNRDSSTNSVFRASSVEEALELISQRNTCNR